MNIDASSSSVQDQWNVVGGIVGTAAAPIAGAALWSATIQRKGRGAMKGSTRAGKNKPGAGAPIGNQSAKGKSNAGPKGKSNAAGNVGPKGKSNAAGNIGGSGAAAGNVNAASAKTRAKKLFEEGKDLDSNGESAAAVEKLKAAIVLDPSNAEAHYLVAHVQYHSTYPITGEFSKELYGFCTTCLKKAMALGHAQAQHLLAVIIVRGETGHGRGVYSTEKQALVLGHHEARTSMPLPSKELSLEFNWLGAVKSVFGRPLSETKPLYLKAIALDSTSYESFFNLAAAYYNAGEFQKCLEHCDAALKIRCTYEIALDLKTKVLEKLRTRDLDVKAYRLSLMAKEKQDYNAQLAEVQALLREKAPWCLSLKETQEMLRCTYEIALDLKTKVLEKLRTLRHRHGQERSDSRWARRLAKEKQDYNALLAEVQALQVGEVINEQGEFVVIGERSLPGGEKAPWCPSLKETQEALSWEEPCFQMEMQRCIDFQVREYEDKLNGVDDTESQTDESEDEAGKDPKSDDESQWEDEQEEEGSVLKGTMEVDIEAE